jgi:hypothetical protein
MRVASRPRGLCWRCFGAPGVRRLYPPRSSYGRRGVANGCFVPAEPSGLTRELPGTPGKVAELCRRAAARRALWHPADGRR